MVDIVRGHPSWCRSSSFSSPPEVGIQLEAFPAAVIALSNLSACFICEIVVQGFRRCLVGSGGGHFERFELVPAATIRDPAQSMRVILRRWWVNMFC